MESWKTFAINKLTSYMARRQALEIIPMQIAEIESTMTNIRGIDIEAVRVTSSKSNAQENLLLSCIAQKEELQRNLQQAELQVSIIDKGLAVLEPGERKVLERLYIEGQRGGNNALAAEFFVDVRTIQRWKDTALRKFTIALYGCIEL